MATHTWRSSIYVSVVALLSILLLLLCIQTTATPDTSDGNDLHLLLISSAVKDGDVLAAAANEQTLVIQYDARSTTLDTLLDSARSALGGRKAASIAIAAHDYGVAKFYLTGTHTISLGSSLVSEEQQTFWRNLGSLIETGGRIDLLACDLASTDEGRKLVDVLADLSGVDVAASTNQTGQPASGGDWLLETANVDIEDIYFSPDSLAHFAGLLVSETSKLLASDAPDNRLFGYSVSISGDRMVIGAYLDNDLGAAAGAAYVFYRTAGDTWTEITKLHASNGEYADNFGWSVAISGDSIVVGAPSKYGNQGVVYIFRETSPEIWEEVEYFNGTSGPDEGRLGWSVAIENDRIVAGEFRGNSLAGAAYVYRETATDIWAKVGTLTAADSTGSDRFGWSVDISGDRVVVGAPYNNEKGKFSGSAYVFRETALDTWEQKAKLNASDGVALDNFGSAVAIDADRIVVGAEADDSSTGAAYVFREIAPDTWNQVEKLTASDGSTTDLFGQSVDVDGDLIVIGSYLDDDDGSASGSAYVFRETAPDTWSEAAKLTASDGAADDEFGTSVSISGDRVVVGSPYDDDVGGDSGSAYVFRKPIVTVNAVSGGSTDHDGETQLNYGENISITLSTASGWDWAGWSGDATGFDNPLTITNIFEDYEITPVFVRQTGTLNVNITAAGSGASYSISGPSDFNGGVPLTGQTGNYSAVVPTGTYIVMFASVPNYKCTVQATSFAVTGNQAQGTLAQDAAETVTGVYEYNVGSLRATLLGTKLGGWKLEMQSEWRKSGIIQSGIPAEDYTVVFKPVNGFETPAPQTVNIYKDTLTDITAIYVEQGKDTGSVMVVGPDDDAPDGAGWRPVLGGSAPSANGGWFAFGETLMGLPEGDLSIEFRSVVGYITPADMYITVKAGKSIRVSADYLRPFIAASSDYDGDGCSDPAVYDPETRMWSVVCSTDGKTTILDKRFGVRGGIPTPGDYDGDSVTDLAYYNPKTGAWRVRKQFKLNNFGAKGDIPVPGDYLGLGHDQPALYRPGEGLWLIHDGSNLITLDFGGTYDIPAPADYDGDGTVDLGIYDVRTGRWRVAIRKGDTTWRQKSSLGVKDFGMAGDIPMPADYDGDGAADIALYRPADNVWRLNIEGGKTIVFGRMGDKPVPADWNNDGAADIAIFRPRNGTWQAIGDIFKARHGKECRPLISSAN